MKARTITAKLRDAVKVAFIENGEQKSCYLNVEIPDSLKELEIENFAFDIKKDTGYIRFNLFFADGV